MVRAINERELATRLLVITWSYSAARLLGCSLRELAAGRCLLLRGGSGRGGRERSTSSLLFRLSEHVCVTPLIVCLCVLQVSHLTQSAYVFFRVSCPVCVTPHRLLMCSASVTRVLPLIESQTCLPYHRVDGTATTTMATTPGTTTATVATVATRTTTTTATTTTVATRTTTPIAIHFAGIFFHGHDLNPLKFPAVA